MLIRDDDGKVIDSAEADSEFERLHQQIHDLRELLSYARRIALESNEKILKGLP